MIEAAALTLTRRDWMRAAAALAAMPALSRPCGARETAHLRTGPCLVSMCKPMSLTSSSTRTSAGSIRGWPRCPVWQGRTAGGDDDDAEAPGRRRPLLRAVLHADRRSGQDVEPARRRFPNWRGGRGRTTNNRRVRRHARLACADRQDDRRGHQAPLQAAGTRQLLEQPRSHECAYATFDPRANRWTAWKILAMPETDGKFFRVGCGCVAMVGASRTARCWCPSTSRARAGSDYQSHGAALHVRRPGDEVPQARRRTGDRRRSRLRANHRWRCSEGKYYLTLRNDARAYVTTGQDGLHFAPVKAVDLRRRPGTGQLQHAGALAGPQRRLVPDLHSARREQRPHRATGRRSLSPKSTRRSCK